STLRRVTAWKTTSSSLSTMPRRRRGKVGDSGAGRQRRAVYRCCEGICRSACVESESENRGVPAVQRTVAGAWIVEPFLSALLALQKSRHLPSHRAVVRVDGHE